MGRRKQTWKFFLFASTFLLQKPEANKKRQSIYKLSVFISISILCVSLFFFLQKDVFVIMIVYWCHIICNYGLSTAQIVIYSVRSSSEVSKQGGWGGGGGGGEEGPVYLFPPHPQLVVDGAPNSFESLFIVLKKKCFYLTYRIKPLPFS